MIYVAYNNQCCLYNALRNQTQYRFYYRYGNGNWTCIDNINIGTPAYNTYAGIKSINDNGFTTFANMGSIEIYAMHVEQ